MLVHYAANQLAWVPPPVAHCIVVENVLLLVVVVVVMMMMSWRSLDLACMRPTRR
jgi:hypothetical protein